MPIQRKPLTHNDFLLINLKSPSERRAARAHLRPQIEAKRQAERDLAANIAADDISVEDLLAEVEAGIREAAIDIGVEQDDIAFDVMQNILFGHPWTPADRKREVRRIMFGL